MLNIYQIKIFYLNKTQKMLFVSMLCYALNMHTDVTLPLFTSHNVALVYQSNLISLMETIILQTVMTYGCKPHNSTTDLNLVTWQSTVHLSPEDGLKNGTETCRGCF
jgi:hypothetical protein